MSTENQNSEDDNHSMDDLMIRVNMGPFELAPEFQHLKDAPFGEFETQREPAFRLRFGLHGDPAPGLMLGRDTGELRLPMCPMDAASDAKLRQTLAGYGLL